MPFVVNQSLTSYRTQKGASVAILLLFFVAVLVSGFISAIFAHKLGYSSGYRESEEKFLESSNGQEVTANNVKALSLQVEILENQLQTATQERDISLGNLSELRDTQRELEISNLQLQQVNDVLSEALREKGGMALKILAAKIEPLPENAFEYRFDVAMLERSGEEIRMVPRLTLLNEDSLVEVPLDPSSYRFNEVSRIRGRFVMPEGFTPKQVKLELSANGQNLTQLYNWQYSKLVADMPLSLSEVPEIDERPIPVEDTE